VRRFYL